MSKEEQVRKMLSDKYNLPDYVINAIVTTPFRLLKDIMETQSMECIIFPYFGKFYVSESKKLKMHDKKAKAKAKRDILRIQKLDMEEGFNREVITEEIKDMSSLSTQ